MFTAVIPCGEHCSQTPQNLWIFTAISLKQNKIETPGADLSHQDFDQ